MADKIKYPVFRWNKEGGNVTCDNAEKVTEATAKGFILASNPHARYPLALYNKAGISAVAHNAKEEADLKSQGFGEDHVAAPVPSEAPTASGGTSLESATVSAIFQEINELRMRVDALEAAATEPPEVAARANRKLKTEPVGA